MVDPTEAVGLTVDDGVATITLQTPENRNALSMRLRKGLGIHLHAATRDPDVHVIVLTGAGPVFCAGADLKEGLVEAPDVPGIVPLLNQILDNPKPVLAVLNGPARAGGIGLVASCDLAIAPDTATFAFSEVRIGVAPAIISIPCLERLTSRAAARYFLTGEVFDATEAVRVGLLTASAPPPEMDALEQQLVAALLEGSPSALAGTKRLLREIPGLPRDVAFAYAERVSAGFFAGAEAIEARRAFAEKRPPPWSRSARA
jgi:enoyl-CoA hydratase/carnithine racemase